MKYYFLYIVFYVFFAQFLSAQKQNLTIEDNFDKAIHYHYTNKDSAYYYYERTIELADQQNNLDYLLYSFQYLINANGHFYDLKNYQLNLQREDSLLNFDKRLNTYPYLEYYKNYLLFDKGNYNYKVKRYAIARQYFQQLHTILNKSPVQKRTKEDMAMLSSIYSFLGLVYKHTGKNELAIYTFQKDLALLKKNRDSIENWESRFFNTKKLISQVYEEKGEFSKAHVLLKETLAFYKPKGRDPSYKNNILSIYKLLAENYIQQKKFQQAILTLKESDKFYLNDNPFEREEDLIYGDAYLGLKKYQKSEKYYKESLQKTKGYRNNQKHQDIATVHARLGNLYVEQQQFDKGLEQYQLALIQLEEDFNTIDFNRNPNPKYTFSKTVLISILKEKSATLYKAYLSTNKLSYLKNAHHTSKVIISTLDELRPEFESKLDKQFLIQKTYPSIQKMVVMAYELYHKTKENLYIDDAFFFMEKSKSIFLLEAIRNAEANKYGEIPEAIINKGQQFRANISYLEQEIFKTTLVNNSLIDSLSSLKNTYYNYLAKIEKEYSKYYDLKYNSDVVLLQTVQQHLQKNQAVLSYLATENMLYLIVIEANGKTLFKLPFDKELKKTIERLYRKSSILNIEDTSIFNDSYAVYQGILEPALQKTEATDLMILADDILQYVPFDALVTTNITPTYLLKTHSISYGSSATLLQEQTNRKRSGERNLLVFAPQFHGETVAYNQQRTDMSPLLYNQQEAQRISQYFNGKVFNGDQASIQNFKNEVSNYGILHFATHASANDEYPDYSYLAFSNDSTASNLLYVKDLYNYTINADLVTLSACQTGIGKLQKGEGMLSLARAFNYAGASAIVTTLWKINDQSTSEIMTNFYKNLSEGLNKKEALRQAKLTYLMTNDDPLLNHPYYWSGIVLTGNALPIVTTISYLWWILWVVLGIVFGWVLFSSLRKKESK